MDQNKESGDSSLSAIEEKIRAATGISDTQKVVVQLITISRQIPQNVNNLRPSRARELAGHFLKGMDLCGELYALAVNYELRMEIEKKKEFGAALFARAKGQGAKTQKEKESYAYTDALYLDAAYNHAEAKMFRALVEDKRKNFEKAHYLMRKVSEEDSVLPDDGTYSVSTESGGQEESQSSGWGLPPPKYKTNNNSNYGERISWNDE